MDCTTVRPGIECPFMTKNGCSFNGGRCNPIVEQCEGCARIIHYNGASYCSSYADPSAKWAFGTCNFATHSGKGAAGAEAKLNPLKASKRRARGK